MQAIVSDSLSLTVHANQDMELFYSDNISPDHIFLDAQEAQHCIKVLRHRSGDLINVIDGQGTLFTCRLEDDSVKNANALIVDRTEHWGSHAYQLTMAVCPTKNGDRYDWFMEKACEMGVDAIVPVIGEHSERKIFKTERGKKILVSAAKQSLKAAVPSLEEPISVMDFIRSCQSPLRLIACCFEDQEHPRRSVKEVLAGSEATEIAVLIGPEGDFSEKELHAAIESGFVPVHLGDSRLRTETAALACVAAVYLNFIR